MSVLALCEGLQFKDVSDTDAFRAEDKLWPFESWDDRQWKAVMKKVKKEIGNGNPSK